MKSKLLHTIILFAMFFSIYEKANSQTHGGSVPSIAYGRYIPHQPNNTDRHPSFLSMADVKAMNAVDKSADAIAGSFEKHHTPNQAQSLIALNDSIYYWTWDTLTNAWELNPYSKEINIVYDANNNLISNLNQTWNGTAWENSSQGTYTYNANNNNTSRLIEYWNGSSWDNSSLRTYTYDANNNRTSDLYQTWSGSSWVNYYLYSDTFDANHNRTSELFQTWNGSNWDNNNLSTYTYNANNKLTSYLRQTWNGTAWENTYLYTYTYDVNNNLTNLLGQEWNSSSSAWENYSQNIYTYNANNYVTNILYQSWNGTAWEPDNQLILTYDANGNITFYSYQAWDGSAWINYFEEADYFDVNDLLQSYAYKSWNNTGTSIELGDSAYFYFHTVSGINDLTAGNASLALYPNPCSGTFWLSIPSSQTQVSNRQYATGNVEIYNSIGEKIYEKNYSSENMQPGDYNRGQMEINFGNQPAGIYLVQIQTPGFIETKRFVVAK